MLTPTGNLQDWIDNQNRQLRSQSRLTIKVYEWANNQLSQKVVLDNSNLESYSINESCSIIGLYTQESNINFTIFKDGTTEFLIKQGNFIVIYYEYLINGVWQSVKKGAYEISKTTVENNGLVAKYEAKIICYKALESEWNVGGIPDANYLNYLSEFYSICRKQYSNMSFNTVGTNLLNGRSTCIPEISNRNLLSILTSLAQANGVRLLVSGFLDTDNNQYGLNISFVATNVIPPENYVVEFSNQYKKPENIESDFAYDGCVVSGTVCAFRKNQDEQPDKVFTPIFSSELINDKFNDFNFDNFLPYKESNYIYHKVYNESGVLVHNDLDFDPEHEQRIIAYTFSNEYLRTKSFRMSASPAIPSGYSVKLYYTVIYSILNETTTINGNNPIEIDNPFVSTLHNEYMNDPVDYNIFTRCSQMFNRFKKKEKIKVECRFDPRLEVGDCVLIAVDSETYKKCVVEHYTMSYNGSFKGTIDSCDLGEIERVFARFYASNKTTMISEQEMWQGETPTAPTTPPNPPATRGNAVYSSIGSFKEWKPTLAPINEDTNFYPTYNNPVFHEYEQTYDEEDTFIGQLGAWTSRPLSIGSIVTPHIANLKKLIGNPSLTIPADDGHGFATTSQPTVFRGDEDNDLWQANYIQFFYNTTTNKWEIGSVKVFSTDEVRTLCIGQDNRLWFATITEKFRNNLTSIEDQYLDVLADKFKYNPTTNSFVYNGQTGETTCAYKLIN